MTNYGLNQRFCCFSSFLKEPAITSKEITESGSEHATLCYSLPHPVVGPTRVWCLAVGR